MSFFVNFFDKGRKLPELSRWLGVPEAELKQWVGRKPEGYSYKSFKIPKKKRGEFREIEAPNPELRLLQKLIYRKLLEPLPLVDSVMGFVSNKSIVHNALTHQQQQVVINLDLKDFFHSISAKRVSRFWLDLGWGKEVSQILTNICCHNERLPQGAPTSPALSNLVNRRLDKRIMGLTRVFSGIYTRYADDITLSFPKFGQREKSILPIITKIINEEGYVIQKKKKIRIQRSHQRQTVTGLVVNQKVNLPRKLRHRIRAMKHYEKMGKLNSKEIDILRGYEAMQEMIQRQTEEYIPIKKQVVNRPRISKKYKVEPINRIKKGIAIMIGVISIIYLVTNPNRELKNKTLSPATTDQAPQSGQDNKQALNNPQIDIQAVIKGANIKIVPKNLTQKQRWAIALGAILIEQNKLPHDQLSLLGGQRDPLIMKRQAMEMMIKDWGITDRESAIKTIDWLANQGHSQDLYWPIVKLVKEKPQFSAEKIIELMQEGSGVTLQEVEKEAIKKAILPILVDGNEAKDKLIYAWDYGRLVFIVRTAYYAGYLTEAEALALIETAGSVINDKFNSWEEYGNNYAAGRALWSMGIPEVSMQSRFLIGELQKPSGAWGQIPWEWSNE